MVGAANALHQPFDVLGRAHLNHQIHIPPVDPQIKRSGADNGAQGTCNHRRLDPFALFARQAAVVNANGQVFGNVQPQVVEKQLCLRAGVVKDQRGAVPIDLFQDRWNGIAPATARPWRRGLGLQHLDIGGGAGICQQNAGLGRQKPGQGGRVFHRGGQAHAAQAGRQALQPCQQQGHLIATFGFGQSVQFIKDHPLKPRKDARRILIGQQKRQ